jgi:hypothetical protein
MLSATHSPHVRRHNVTLCVVQQSPRPKRNFLRMCDWPLVLVVMVILAASALLVLGASAHAPVAGAAMVGAGAALAGAAATKLADLAGERRAETQQKVEASERDLDETRRLCYTALMSKGSGNHYLAATVANALAWHQQIADPDGALAHLKALADNGPGADSSEQWLNGRISEINARLGGAPKAEPPAGAELPG